MKVRTRLLASVALSFLVSACTSSSQQQSDTSLTPVVERASPVSSQSASEVELQQELQSKNAQISALQQQVLDNENQLAELNAALNEKDRMIVELQTSQMSALNLSELEEQKSLRADLESRYAALNLDNELLKRRISQLENENAALKDQVSSLEARPNDQAAMQQNYVDLLASNTNLKENYANLLADNKANINRIGILKQENSRLSESLADLKRQHQVLLEKYELSKANESTRTAVVLEKDNDDSQLRSELAGLRRQIAQQSREIQDYQDEVLKLESTLDEDANYEARIKALDSKLAQSEKNNTALTQQLNSVGAELSNAQSQLTNLVSQLELAQQALEAKENDTISLAAALDSLRSQLRATLGNVEWQLPGEIALNNNFEIIVSAEVSPALSGQTYRAELVTDSDINTISNTIATAVVQNGRLQWRWRLAGLNEKPAAQLNLFVSQQISFQDQTFERQMYRSSQTLSLINTNLFEKYGYWVGAILLGLLGGFLIGRINKSKSSNEFDS